MKESLAHVSRLELQRSGHLQPPNQYMTTHLHQREKAMAPHSSTPAWRIPGMEEPGGLPSMGPHRVGHDLAAAQRQRL